VEGTGEKVGGLVGVNNAGIGSITSSYYNTETSEQIDTDRGIPKTTEYMKSREFVVILRLVAGFLSANAWIYSEGEYPKLSNTIVESIYSRGDGTEGNPYIIETKEQLDTFSLSVNLGLSYSEKYLKLGNDITINDTTYWSNWNWNPELERWRPIGDATNSFQGTFDGDGHVISGIYFNSNTDDYPGLFGFNSGTIKNLRLSASYINGGNYAGGVAGRNEDGGTITNSCATGKVEAWFYGAGGLVGENYGIITNSCATGKMERSSGAGSLVGWNHGTISNSYATGNVERSNVAGGLVGRNSGTITNSYATGKVQGQHDIGGLVGYNEYGTITNSYATGEVEGEEAGGLVGYNYNGTISNSYATGNVEGEYTAGGFVGCNTGTITNSFATGKVEGTDEIGGFMGCGGAGTISNSYYNTETNGQDGPGKGEGKTTAQMQSKNNYNGWDFNGIWEIDYFNNKMPYFQWRNTMKLMQAEPIKPQKDTGSPIITLTPEVKTQDGTTLRPGIDFDYYYGENIHVSTGGTVYIVAKPESAYYGTKTMNFIIKTPILVNVQWLPSCGKIYDYDGTPKGPDPISGTSGYTLTAEKQTNAAPGGIVTTAKLAEPEKYAEDFIILQNDVCVYTISPKTLKVIWTEDSVFTYNNNVQAPVPSVSESNVELLRYNAKSEVGIYKDENAVSAEIKDQQQARNYNLTNRTKNYEIKQRPLEAGINGGDNISLDISYIDNIESIRAYLLSLVTYSGFATNTETKETDDPSVLSGSPSILVSELENELDTLDGFARKKYSVSIDASAVSAKNYIPTNGKTYIIPVSSAALVPVTWGGTITFVYDGTEHAPTATAGDYDIEVIGKQTNAGGYTATAKLKTPNERVFLQNENMAYTIDKKPLEVSWTSEREFVYNKMTQGPTPSVDEPGVELRASTTYSGVGEYTAENKRAPYAVIISSNANNYELLNNSVDYEILPKSLKPYFSTTLSTFEYNSDTLWVPSEVFTDTNALQTILEQVIAYNGFATDDKGDSDDASVLNGAPKVSIEYDTASRSMLSKRVETTQKATATIITDGVSADNYVLTRQSIVVMETIDDEAEAEKINCYRGSYCTELSKEVCEFIDGEKVANCAALKKACVIDDRCIPNIFIGECTGIGGKVIETTCEEVPILRPQFAVNSFRIWQTASGMVNVDLGYMPTAPAKLQIYDLKGKLVASEQVNARFANVKVGVPSGVYLFKVGNRNTVGVIR